MANRYWVGGVDNWDGVAGAKWSETSGGPGGASVPTLSDDVFFDANSTGGPFISSGNLGARSIDCTGFSGSINGSAPITVDGSITLSPAMLLTYTGTVSITGSGVITTFGNILSTLTISSSGTVSLGDNLTITSTLTLNLGVFDAASYDVTASSFFSSSGQSRVLKMGSGLWTLTGISAWSVTEAGMAIYKNSANILLSNNSTLSRIFTGGGFSYNKVTLGGATSTNTTTILGENQFGELASTKTVAHSISLQNSQRFGKWSVSGSPGNVVTVSSVSGTSHQIVGSAVSGVDYLSMGSTSFSSVSPGEFYAGANSSTSSGAPVYASAAPSPRTLYWVGGSGIWSSSSRWSTTSGGAGGAAPPTSLDDVVFDSASSASSYTVSLDVVGRCNSLTVSAPSSGTMTFSGLQRLIVHGNVSLPSSSGMSWLHSNRLVLSGSTSGKTINFGFVALGCDIEVNGVGAYWTVLSNLNIPTSRALTVTSGSIDFNGNPIFIGDLRSSNKNERAIYCGSSLIALKGNNTLGIDFGTTEAERANLVFDAGVSSIETVPTYQSSWIQGNNQTFYDIKFFNASNATETRIYGDNTFNNFVFERALPIGVKRLVLLGNQTISGTLTFTSGSSGNSRVFVLSDTIGSVRTLTCSAVASVNDVDFRDIAISGPAVSGGPIVGARIGDCGGNSGITFDAPKSVYYVNTSSAAWSSASNWSLTPGGAASSSAFPLAQDTAVVGNSFPSSGGVVTMDALYNIGSLDMSGRLSNAMTLSFGNFVNTIYGNWTAGPAVTFTVTNTFYGQIFAGRSTQLITSAGRQFPGYVEISCPNSGVELVDNLSVAGNINITGTNSSFNANNKNVSILLSFTAQAASPGGVISINVGSGVWSIGYNWAILSSVAVSGDGTIKMTRATSKSFAGNSVNYGNIVLEQAGSGTLTITGNNTFRSIASSAPVANTISMSGTTQTIAGQWTAKGSAGNLLTISGGSLVGLSTGVSANIDYVNISSNSASPANAWYAGANSVNSGSSGWIFTAAPVSAGFFMLL